MSATLPTLIIVSGLSGSGKSVALRTLEDQDYYCVDNLPAELLTDFVRNMAHAQSPRPRLAVGIDVRNVSSDLSRMGEWLSAVAALVSVSGEPFWSVKLAVTVMVARPGPSASRVAERRIRPGRIAGQQFLGQRAAALDRSGSRDALLRDAVRHFDLARVPRHGALILEGAAR